MLNSLYAGLFFFLVLGPPAAPGQGDPLLEAALAGLEPGCTLEVTTVDGTCRVGRLAGTRPGELLLHLPDGRDASPWALPRGEITRLREETSGAGKGWRTGFTTGAVAGGSLALLFGLALSDLDGDSDDDTGGILAFTGLGVAAGGVGLGLVGTGLGALTTVWQTRYEAPGLLPPTGTPADTGPTDWAAVGLGLAAGSDADSDYSGQGLLGQAGLRLALGSRFTVGPELAYHDVGGTLRRGQPGNTSLESVGSLLVIGLAATWESPRSGWAPFLVAGTGFYFGEDDFPGLSLGGGLRHRTASHRDLRLEVRRHLSLQQEPTDFRFDELTTVGAVFAFGL